MTGQSFTKGNVAFDKSQTKDNLMRAFAGESQARNRYTFAASQAKKEGLAVVSQVFTFTAAQEQAHARPFTSSSRSCPARPSRWTVPIRWTCTRIR